MTDRHKRRADSQRALLAALKAGIGGDATIAATRRTPWASATFSGTRHRLELRFAAACPDAERIVDALPEMDFRLPGHLVADVVIVDRRPDDAAGVTVTVEALTIEED